MATLKYTYPDGEESFYCSVCDCVLDVEVMCDCQEFVKPVSHSESFTVTCDSCGYSGSLEALRLHSCAIQEQGGRCEDFPACGHTDGDGCQTLPEHTADYWTRLRQNNPDLYDYYDEVGWPGEQ